MRKLLLIIPLLPLLAACSRGEVDGGDGPSMESIEFDEYGGIIGMEGENESGFFRTGRYGGRLFLVTPANHMFFSLGTNTANFDGDNSPDLGYSPYRLNNIRVYGGDGEEHQKEWAGSAREKMTAAFFNTLGGWCSSGNTVFESKIPYTVSLGFMGGAASGSGGEPCPSVNESGFVDVFDERFDESASRYADASISDEMVEDPYLIGYFIDNEIHWFGKDYWWEWPDWNLADDFIALSPDHEGKRTWVYDFLAERYTLNELNQAYGTTYSSWEEVLEDTRVASDEDYPAIAADKEDFIGLIAEQYFSVTDSALRSRDPNHLNLGCRFATFAPIPAIRACTRYVDLISVNDYYTLEDELLETVFGTAEWRWNTFYELSIEEGEGKPLLHTEFSRRGDDSGLPNTWGAGFNVESQWERGAYYTENTEKLLSFSLEGTKYVLGFHWFEWRDEPALGRFDGENCNFGINTIRDTLYLPLVASMGSRNLEILYHVSEKVFLKAAPPILSSPSREVVEDEFPTLSWSPQDEYSSFELMISPDKAFANDWTVVADGIESGSFTLPLSLPAGEYHFSVRTVKEGAHVSDYAAPLSFTLSPALDPERIEDYLGFQTLSHCSGFWDYETPDQGNGRASALPDREKRVEGTASARVVMTVNSYGKDNRVRGGDGGEVPFSCHFPDAVSVDEGGALSLSIFPERVYTPSGHFYPSSKFLNLRLKDPAGSILAESSLDPEGVLPIYQWSTVSFQMPSGGEVSVLELFVDINGDDLPLDQPLIFNIDRLETL